MINRKCKCENKVNIRKKAVLKTEFSGKVDLVERTTALKKQGSLKSRGSEKIVQSKSSFIINWPTNFL